MTSAVPRLKRRSEFVRVAKHGQRWVAPGLIVQVLVRSSANEREDPLRPVRVGFTVSRRVGNAVSRNRVRRRLRSAVDEVLPLYAREGRDYVIIGRAATLKRPYNSLLNDLTVALKRLGASRAGEETRGRPRRTDNEPGT